MAFIGQATASTTMSYHMMGMAEMNSENQSQKMPMMDHSSHKMVSDSSATSSETSKASTEDCCNKTCNCFMGGCTFFAIFINASADVQIIDSSAKIFSLSRVAQSHQTSSLYRPPILS